MHDASSRRSRSTMAPAEHDVAQVLRTPEPLDVARPLIRDHVGGLLVRRDSAPVEEIQHRRCATPDPRWLLRSTTSPRALARPKGLVRDHVAGLLVRRDRARVEEIQDRRRATRRDSAPVEEIQHRPCATPDPRWLLRSTTSPRGETGTVAPRRNRDGPAKLHWRTTKVARECNLCRTVPVRGASQHRRGATLDPRWLLRSTTSPRALARPKGLVRDHVAGLLVRRDSARVEEIQHRRCATRHPRWLQRCTMSPRALARPKALDVVTLARPRSRRRSRRSARLRPGRGDPTPSMRNARSTMAPAEHDVAPGARAPQGPRPRSRRGSPRSAR